MELLKNINFYFYALLVLITLVVIFYLAISILAFFGVPCYRMIGSSHHHGWRRRFRRHLRKIYRLFAPKDDLEYQEEGDENT